MRKLIPLFLVSVILPKSVLAGNAAAELPEVTKVEVPTFSGAYQGPGTSGAFQWQMPLDIPSGRAGHTPALSFSYDSQSGNGLLGMGWHLSGIPALGRVPNHAGVQFQGTDTFAVWEGGWERTAGWDDRLVEAAPGRYRRWIDDQADYRPHGVCGDGPCWWEVRDKDGRTWFYGGDAQHNAQLTPSAPEVIWEPEFRRGGRRGVQFWGLYKVQDRHGNYWKLSYLDAPGRLLPDKIQYNLHPQFSGEIRSLKFEYEARPDTTAEPHPVQRRLLSVATMTGGIVGGTVTACYHLRYDQSPTTERSRLVGVDLHPRCDWTSEVRNLASFTWHSPPDVFSQDIIQQDDLYGWDSYEPPLHSPFISLLGDINGDARDDLVRVRLGRKAPPGDLNNYGCGPSPDCTETSVGFALGQTNPSRVFGEVVNVLQDHGPNGYTSDWTPLLTDADADGADDLIIYRLRSFASANASNAQADLTVHRVPGRLRDDTRGDLGGLESWVQVALDVTVPGYDHRGRSFFQVIPGDFDDDGLLDLVLVGTFSNKYAYYAGAIGPGGYELRLMSNPVTRWAGPAVDHCLREESSDPGVIGPIYTWLDDPVGCVVFQTSKVGDFNGDGHPDVALFYQTPWRWGIAKPAYFQLAYALGGPGGLSRFVARPKESIPTSSSLWPVVGDFDGDRRQDIVLFFMGKTGIPNQPSHQNFNYPGGHPYGYELYLVAGGFDAMPSQSLVSTLVQSTQSYRDFTRDQYGSGHWPLALDVDGDGRSELASIYRGFYGEDLNLTRFTRTSVVPTSNAEHFLDITDFAPPHPCYVDGRQEPEIYRPHVVDIGGDNQSDLAVLTHGWVGTHVHYRRAQEGGAPLGSRWFDQTAYPAGERVCFGDLRRGAGLGDQLWGDLNADGRPDLVLVDNFFPNRHRIYWNTSASGPSDLVSAVRLESGYVLRVGYQSSAQQEGAVAPSAGCSALPADLNIFNDNTDCGRPSRRPLWVVSRVDEAGLGDGRDLTFRYENGREHVGPSYEGGWRGFSKMITTEGRSGVRTETWFYMDALRAGRPRLTLTLAPSGERLAAGAYHWVASELTAGNRRVAAMGQVDQTYEVGTSGPWAVYEWSRQVDEYGFETERAQRWGEGQQQRTTYQWHHDPSGWRLGQLQWARTDAGPNFETNIDYRRYRYYPGTLDRRATERLLHLDAETAVCPQDIEASCAPAVSAGTARWVTLEQNIVYDLGNIISQQDAQGAQTTWAYEPRWQVHPASEQNALGHQVSWRYDNHGRQLSETGPNGDVTHLSYGATGLLEGLRDPLPGVPATGNQRWSVDFGRNVETKCKLSRAGEESCVDRAFDGLGRVTYQERWVDDQTYVATHFSTHWQPNGIRVERFEEPYYCRAPMPNTPDPAGSPCDPAPALEISYDILGRSVGVIKRYPDGTSKPLVTTEYHGNLYRVRDVHGGEREYLLRSAKRLVERLVDAAGNVTRYEYDPAGRVQRVILPTQEIVRYRYDSWGRVVRIEHPQLGQQSFAYDDIFSKVTQRTNALGQHETSQLDLLGRLRVVSTATTTTEYFYDSPTVIHGVGRLSEVRVSAGVTVQVMAYDAVGNETERRTYLPTIFGYHRQTRQYDWLGRLLRKEFPNGTVQEMAYHPNNGLLKEIRVDGDILAEYREYSASGQLLQWGMGDVAPQVPNQRAVESWINYDLDGRPTNLYNLSLHPIRGDVLQDIEYTYDASGNLLRMLDGRLDPVIDGVDTSATQTMTYDALGRMTSASGRYGHLTYRYDAIGRIIENAGTLSRAAPCAGSPVVGRQCREGRLGGRLQWVEERNLAGYRTKFWDAAQGETMAHRYDARGRLVETLKDGVSVARTVFGAGQKWWKDVDHWGLGFASSTRTYYLQDYELRQSTLGGPGSYTETIYIQSPFGLLATVTPVLPLPDGPHATDVYQATGPLLGTTTRGLASGTWLHLPNHVGSNTVVVDTSGLPVARYVYEPFGRLSKDHSWGYDVTTRQYTGQEMEAETGLYDYGARHYDPKLAEFLVPDEVLLGNGLNPQGYNLTAYVLNQPLRFIDPTGRAPLESVGNFLGEQADKLVATGGATLHVVAGALDGISPVPLNTQPDPDHELAFAAYFGERGHSNRHGGQLGSHGA